MMRYQRVVTPDTCNNPLSNTNNTNNNNNNHVAVGGGGGGGGSGGDVLFQWGQKKRARVPRSFADESSSSSSASANKIKQQQFINNNNKLHKTTTPPVTASTTTAVLPPPLPRRINKDFSSIRNLDERSPVGNGSPSRNTSAAASRAISRSAAANKRSPTPEKVDKKSPKKNEKLNGSLADNNVTRIDSASGQSEKEVKAVVGGGQKVHQEWPRIYVNLSKKEKEEDFMAMRGTKLPHRPKKRPKNVDRALQYCFPGMWLPDVTKSRYEVREKKCVKKQKRRGGLKGMESMETDSE